MTPNILFEDEQMLVIDKPSGITVNKSETTIHEKTIQDWAESKLRIRSTKHETRNKSKIDKSNDQNSFELRNSDLEFRNRGGIVHRLDKETSGILLIAKTVESFDTLQQQFKLRTVQKQYRALVHGKVVPREGEIRVPVGRLPWNRKQYGIVAGGREAVTRFHVEKYYTSRKTDKLMSYLVLYPETGRTHQIRVHLKYIGHPIFADFLYAGRKTAREDRKVLKRVFLHAWQVSLTHPTTKEQVTFTADLPEDLESVLKDHFVEVI